MVNNSWSSNPSRLKSMYRFSNTSILCVIAIEFAKLIEFVAEKGKNVNFFKRKKADSEEPAFSSIVNVIKPNLGQS